MDQVVSCGPQWRIQVEHALLRNVCAANNFAAEGASGDSNSTLQVDHASDYHQDGIWMVRGEAGHRPKAKVVFTECWKSWSQVFAESREALSGARLKTSSADRTAWMLSVAAMVADGERWRMLRTAMKEKCGLERRRSQFGRQSRLFVDVDD